MKSRDDSEKLYRRITSIEDAGVRRSAMRRLARSDLYFLLVWVLGRRDARNSWCFDRCREVQGDPDGRLDLWARDHYKMEPLAEVVPTPYSGWVKHGQLEPGDWVFGPDGQPTKVIARTEVFTDGECYRITFDDGTINDCGADHLWQVQKKSRRRIPGTKNKRYKFDTMVMDTRALAAHGHGQDNRYSIATTEPVAYPTSDLIVPPYTLGAWLGDGTTLCGVITKPDQFVFDRIADEGFDIGAVIGPASKGQRTVYGLQTALKEVGVFGDKHIPEDYLQADVDQRIALLQGLMDTDGHCDTRGTATFVNTNERIVDGLVEVARSLGLKPHKRRYENDYGPWWQVSFQAYQEPFCPFSLPRKVARCKKGRCDSRRFITSVEPIAPLPCSCIQVDRKDGLYLVGSSFLTTHNSTIISVALSIQEILKDPNVTIGVFSFNAGAAQDIVAQIKREFESRSVLRWLFPEIIWENPHRDAPSWSVQNGITVNRKDNPRECTVEGHSFMEGAPVGKHFAICLYDDVVTMDSVATPEMITKTTNRWELSIPLGRKDAKRRYVGTRYHFQDTYAEMMNRQAAVPRLHPAEDDDGNPVFLTREQLDEKRRTMGPMTYSSQMMLNPTMDATAGFLEEWLRYYDDQPSLSTMNVYIVVDPANEKKRDSDWTAMWVIGLSADYNYYVLDMVRDRMSLQDRARKLMELHRKWSPSAKTRVRKVGYEKYGKDADIEAITMQQVQENYRFAIVPLGGRLSKLDRINRLEPVFAASRFYFPRRLIYTQYDGIVLDLVSYFREQEYKPYPAIRYKDLIDALARILDEDLGTVWPKPVDNTTPLETKQRGTPWSA